MWPFVGDHLHQIPRVDLRAALLAFVEALRLRVVRHRPDACGAIAINE